MKKRTKASKKRLNNLLIILLLTAVLLIMSTYAWFTANRTVNIDSIDVEVSTSSGLQISADGITWKTVLSKDDLVNAYSTYPAVTNQLPELMAPVSSSLEIDASGHLRMFYGSVAADLQSDPNAEGSTYGEYLLTSIPQTDKPSQGVDTSQNEYAKGYYIAFDIFLKNELEAEKLFMSGSVAETGTYKGLENAARVGLIKGDNYGGTVDSTTDVVNAIQALTTVDGYAWLWEPNCDVHTQNAIDNANSLGWYTDRTFVAGSGNAKLPYDGIKNNFEDNSVVLAKGTSADYPDYFTAMEPNWSTSKAAKPSLLLQEPMVDNGEGVMVAPASLSAGVTKFRVYLWIEGQDIDCENYASGTEVAYDLSFSLDSF